MRHTYYIKDVIIEAMETDDCPMEDSEYGLHDNPEVRAFLIQLTGHSFYTIAELARKKSEQAAEDYASSQGREV